MMCTVAVSLEEQQSDNDVVVVRLSRGEAVALRVLLHHARAFQWKLQDAMEEPRTSPLDAEIGSAP